MHRVQSKTIMIEMKDIINLRITKTSSYHSVYTLLSHPRFRHPLEIFWKKFHQLYIKIPEIEW